MLIIQAAVPLLLLTMGEWKHHLDLPLGVQLPTLVTLATHCLVHRHVLVELMEYGHSLNQAVNEVHTRLIINLTHLLKMFQ